MASLDLRVHSWLRTRLHHQITDTIPVTTSAKIRFRLTLAPQPVLAAQAVAVNQILANDLESMPSSEVLKFCHFERLTDVASAAQARGLPVPAADLRVYEFKIGSVDSFERKLEEAQKELGFTVDKMVPVVYAAESDLVGGFMRFVPVILLIMFPCETDFVL